MAAPGASERTVDDVTRDLLAEDRVEAGFEVIEAVTADVGQGQRVTRRGCALRQLSRGCSLLTQPEGVVHVEGRIGEPALVYFRSGPGAGKEVFDAELVLEIVLVEQGVPKEA